jgi:transposase
MWECRRRPNYEDSEQRAALEALFDELPKVGFAVSFRWDVTEVFDTAKDREEAASQLEELRALLDEDDTEFRRFYATYDRWKDGILAYFDDRKTSGVVEGVNAKARVITRRAYGLKTAAAVWTRLQLDLNLAHQAVRHTVQRLRALAQGIQSKFAHYYT